MTPLRHVPKDGHHRKTARNIEAILKLEKEGQCELSHVHRLFHRVGGFVGTIYFSVFQCISMLLWIGLNVGPKHLRQTFDPYPFPLLSLVLALEAVFLTSFVLVRQAAIDKQSERRNHLDLQINMLAEEEATAILKLLRLIAERMDIDERNELLTDDALEEAPVERIARHLKAQEK
jgi:uncharacterized membrane protein